MLKLYPASPHDVAGLRGVLTLTRPAKSAVRLVRYSFRWCKGSPCIVSPSFFCCAVPCADRVRDVEDYRFMPNTYQNFIPTTEDRSADFAPADPHRMMSPACVRISSVYVSTFSFQAYASSITPGTWEPRYDVRLHENINVFFLPGKCFSLL